MSRKLEYSILCAAFVWILALGTGWAQSPPESESADATEQAAQEARFQRFAELLSPSVLVGSFTIDGKPSALEQERYELSGVSKLPSGDLWLFKARIQYGDHDVTVPLPLPVKWAGDTPVITLDDFAIPGLGTFSAESSSATENTPEHGATVKSPAICSERFRSQNNRRIRMKSQQAPRRNTSQKTQVENKSIDPFDSATSIRHRARFSIALKAPIRRRFAPCRCGHASCSVALSVLGSAALCAFANSALKKGITQRPQRRRGPRRGGE